MKKSRFAEEQIAGGILLDHQTGDNTTALRAYLISHVFLADEDARIDDLRQQVVPIAAVRVCQVHAEITAGAEQPMAAGANLAINTHTGFAVSGCGPQIVT